MTQTSESTMDEAIDAAAAALMKVDGIPSPWEYALEPRRNHYRALVRATLPAIRSGLAAQVRGNQLVNRRPDDEWAKGFNAGLAAAIVIVRGGAS